MSKLNSFQKKKQGANEYMKCSTFLALNKMQIKTALRLHFTIVKMSTIKKSARHGGTCLQSQHMERDRDRSLSFRPA